ncbi:hypothetical protein LINPERHAP2_LOCUS16924 [Linum perenne]
MIELDGSRQYVEYENIPKLCFRCGRVRHEEDVFSLATGRNVSLRA